MYFFFVDLNLFSTYEKIQIKVLKKCNLDFLIVHIRKLMMDCQIKEEKKTWQRYKKFFWGNWTEKLSKLRNYEYQISRHLISKYEYKSV